MATEKTQAKGIRKINLADLAGSLSKKGRTAFFDDTLKDALMALMLGEGNENAFIWDDGFVNPNKAQNEQTKLQAKFRSRANSVVKQIVESEKTDFAITVQYTNDGDMVISKRGVKA
jgi:hypothetical protein